ncbi:MAG TPA: DUF3179 domain-containing (seleno)protein [Thermoanaerobaculia bacterium]|nr:DUF3179 domain-containing (seleno)protein [Thermoanaerobaculia bacterium]
MRTFRLPATLLSFLLVSRAGAALSAPPPPLDHAPLVRERAAAYLKPDDLVLGVEIGGDARAYPLAILERHGVANDTIGRIPVALAWCRPCGSAVAYRTDTPKGTLTLAVSGKLRDGQPLLGDRQTGTLWNPLTGTPVEGALAGLRLQLQPLPVVLTTWTRWFQSHLESRVLAQETAPQGAEAQPGSEPAGPWVYGVTAGGATKAYPVDLVAKLGVIDDEIGGRPVVVVAEPGADPKGRTIRVYDRGDRVFSRSGHSFLGASFVNDQGGRAWKIGEEALTITDGQTRARIPGKLAVQAAWVAAYPGAVVWAEPKTP